jgi:hypothetical protein
VPIILSFDAFQFGAYTVNWMPEKVAALAKAQTAWAAPKGQLSARQLNHCQSQGNLIQ